jgi:hypothetical protein
MVVPPVPLDVPEIDVSIAVIGAVTVGTGEVVFDTMTEDDATDTSFPEAVAFAVITSLVRSVAPVNVLPLTRSNHPVLVTVVVPIFDAEAQLPDPRAQYTSIVVPLTSLLVPAIVAEPAVIGELTVGAADTALTVTPLERVEGTLPEAVAFAVTTCPAVSAVIEDFVHALLDTVPVPTRTPST